MHHFIDISDKKPGAIFGIHAEEPLGND